MSQRHLRNTRSVHLLVSLLRAKMVSHFNSIRQLAVGTAKPCSANMLSSNPLDVKNDAKLL